MNERIYIHFKIMENNMQDKKLEILKSGRELFSEKGFKDTNVSEITKRAGIATGTFYSYYISKDKLFMDIFLEENIKLKQEIIEGIDIKAHPREVVGVMMLRNNVGMQSNPILKEWYNRDVSSRIEQLYRQDNGIDLLDFMHERFIEIIKMWQDQGKFRQDIDAKMIMAIFGALINVDTHKDEIGINYFPKVIEYMAELIMNGLMTTQ